MNQSQPGEKVFTPGVASVKPHWKNQVPGHTEPMREDRTEPHEQHTAPVTEVHRTAALGGLASKHKKPINTTGDVYLAAPRYEGDPIDRFTLLQGGKVSVDTSTVGMVPTHLTVNNYGIGGKIPLIVDMAPTDPNKYSDDTLFVADQGEGVNGRFLVMPYDLVEELQFGPKDVPLAEHVRRGRAWQFDPGQSATFGREAGLDDVIGIQTNNMGVSRKQFEIHFAADAIEVENLGSHTNVSVNTIFKK